MSILDDLKMYGRFAFGLAFGLRRYLRNTITLEEAEETVHRRLADREHNFLRVLERGIFRWPKSPYLPLLRMAGCEFGDIRNMVRKSGLEKTLLALREAGVYVTFEEFKGRQPIVRNGKVIPVKDHDFDNPYSKKHYYAESGGSTGAGTRVHHDLDYLAEGRAVHYLLTFKAHNVLDVPTAVWRGILPDGSGINTVLSMARFKRPPQKWFTPVTTQDLRTPLLKFRAATYFTVLLGRSVRAPLPWPQPVPIDRAAVVARWAAETLKQHGACVVNAAASRALRVCVAAREEGLELTGATFVVAGEPVTPAKVRGIQRTGAKYFTTYGFSEAGRIGMGCCHPISSNDLHLMTDICAIIQFPRQVPGSDLTVPAFNVTCLLPSSPKILLNAESDDYGILETRSCGCPLEKLGFTTHVREIRSFQKLTGEGVTLVGSEMVHILEEVLPSRFGGSSLDYQVMEEEDDEGFTRISLVVSPNIEIADESAVVSCVLDAMGRESLGADVARAMWSQAGTLRVKRMHPVWTARGKLMPLYVPKRHGNAIQ
jgi:phenylacetate-coenzyme A ligase PaaK-like adenylate-forming protein